MAVSFLYYRIFRKAGFYLKQVMMKDSDQLQEITGYISQKFGFYEVLTVLDNLKLYADLHNLTGKKVKLYKYKAKISFKISIETCCISYDLHAFYLFFF